MSNGNDPWMPLYIGDYLGDTMELDGAQHGAYLLLLMYYWRNGPLPIDDTKLAQIARTDARVWKKTVGPVVRAFFQERSGRLHQKRADLELERAREKCARAVEQRQADNQRLKAWRAKTGQDGARPPLKPNGHATEDETRFIGVSPPFQEAFRNGPETPSETALKPVLQSEPETQVQPDKEERKVTNLTFSSPVLARVATPKAGSQPALADALQALMDEAEIEKPQRIDRKNDEPPSSDPVVLSHINRTAKALRMSIPYGQVRSAEVQIDAMQPQPKVVGADAAMGLKWQPKDPENTVEAQTAAALAGVTPEQLARAQRAFAQRATPR